MLLPLCLALAHAKRRGEQPNGSKPLPNRRALLGNVFADTDALRHSLSTQRQPYQDPFKDEPKIKNLAARTQARQREFRKMGTTRDAHEPETAADEPMLDLDLRGKGTGVGKMVMRAKNASSGSSKGKTSYSSGKGKGKGMSSKSKTKGASKASAMSKSRSMSRPTRTDFPTFVPSSKPTIAGTVGPTPAPVATGKPTCANTGFFPPDVSGFFGAPMGDGSDLQNELDSTLNQIQVPSEFSDQCVER